jgi:rSAM/selenodomain-associated transferase 2
VQIPQISIVIPTLNEAPRLEALIEALQLMGGPEREIVVSDGGSSDETTTIARQKGVLVAESARGRGAQLNAGASVASGGILWFVHADARAHRRSLEYLDRCAENSQLCGGNFRLRFDEQTPATRLFARIARQQRRLGLYYGDSGIWVRRAVFDELNGFRNWPLFEDYDFARRLEVYARRHGRQTALAPLPITVSSRRFQKNSFGTLRQWLWLQILFWGGVSPEKLAQIYHSG